MDCLSAAVKAGCFNTVVNPSSHRAAVQQRCNNGSLPIQVVERMETISPKLCFKGLRNVQVAIYMWRHKACAGGSLARPRLTVRYLGGGGAEWQPGLLRLTHPPTHTRKVFLSKELTFIKGARNCRSTWRYTNFFLASDGWDDSGIQKLKRCRDITKWPCRILNRLCAETSASASRTTS